MNRARNPIVALVAGLLFAACMHVPVAKGPRSGQNDPLPADPGPGFLYIRVVSGSDTVSYAVIVSVPDPKSPKVIGVVGPIDDWPNFFGKVRATYWAHGPGEAYCARSSTGKPCSDLPRSPPPPAQAQLLPPHPPPPGDGFALAYLTQAGAVNPDDPALSDAAAGAGSAAAAAIGQ